MDMKFFRTSGRKIRRDRIRNDVWVIRLRRMRCSGEGRDVSKVSAGKRERTRPV
jgi:hypothetical protein